MNLRRSILAPAAILLLAVLTGGWFLQRGVSQERNVYVQARLLQEVVDHVENRYVDPVEENELYRSAIDGLLESLDDPNTSFLEASDYENLRIRTEGEYGGVGLEVTQRNGWVTVVTALPESPATRAGVRAGDRIVRVEERSTEGWSVSRVVDVLRGEEGTDVELRVKRPGVEGTIPFTVTRERIQLHSVPFATRLEGDIGYVPLQLMSETSSQEVREGVDSLRGEGLRGLIFDLRGNPGGLLDQGVGVSDLFLSAEQVVVETRGRAPGQDQVFRADDPAAYDDLSVVVLVNGHSASASEIVAGALQDHDRALLIGTPSFGKGSVQTLYRLTGGNVLKLTTARWYTPAGRSIEKTRGDSASAAAHPEAALDEEDVGILTLQGDVVERPDTAGRPTFRTDAGRTVYGGGGITPDLLILPDTLTDAEEAAVRQLFEAGGAFWTAIFNHAVAYLQEDPDLSPGFRLSDAEMDAFYQRLSGLDVEVERDRFDEAIRFVRYQLEREIANQKWGRLGEFRHTLSHDRQIQRALELLRDSEGQRQLFTAAGSPLPASGDAGAGGPSPSSPGGG